MKITLFKVDFDRHWSTNAWQEPWRDGSWGWSWTASGLFDSMETYSRSWVTSRQRHWSESSAT